MAGLEGQGPHCAWRPLQRLWRTGRARECYYLGGGVFAGLVVCVIRWPPMHALSRQEPGTDEEVYNFATSQYGATFPLTSKEAVLGDHAHSLYLWMERHLGEASRPTWNFQKCVWGLWEGGGGADGQSFQAETLVWGVLRCAIPATRPSGWKE